MRNIHATLVLAALVAAPASASELDSLKGRYGFNWFSNPGKAKCALIDEKRIQTFQSSYACDLKPDMETASHAAAVKCKSKDGRAEYLIFASQKACETERQTQAANAE